jgi:hypothetical protein
MSVNTLNALELRIISWTTTFMRLKTSVQRLVSMLFDHMWVVFGIGVVLEHADRERDEVAPLFS